MKKALLISGCILILAILSVPALFFIYKDQVRLRAEQEINKHINGSILFDDISISLFKDFPNLTLTFEKVIVVGNETFAADTLAQVAEFDIELKTSSLISGDRIEIKSGHLKEPILYFDILENGLANYNSIVSKSPTQTTVTSDSSSDVNLVLDQISIENGIFIYEDHAMGLFVRMKGLTYIGKGDYQQHIFDLETETEINEFTLDYGSIRYFSNKHIWASVLMEMNLKENKFTFKENSIRINHFKFGIDGTFTMAENAYDIDLKFKTRETSFKNILSLVPGVYVEDFNQMKTAGELAFNGFVRGKYSDHGFPSFLIDIKVKDAMFKIDTLPAPVENIQLDLVVKNDYGRADSTIFDLRNFHMDMQHHPIHGRVKVKGFPNFIVDADIFADVDLAELEKMYPISGMELNGKLKAELSAKGQYIGSAFHDSTDVALPKKIPAFHLTMNLADGEIKYDHLPTPIENIQLNIAADNLTGELKNTVLDIKAFHLDMGKNPVHGTARITGYPDYVVNADVKAMIDLADLEKIYPIENIVVKGLLDVDLEANGTYNQAKKKFPLVDAKLNLTDGYLKSKDSPEPMKNIHFTTEALNKTGKLSDTRLTITQLTYTLEDEPFEVSGNISDFENYDYDLKIKGLIDLEKVTRIYHIDGVQVKGLINTDLKTRGRLADIEAKRYDKIKSEGTIEVKDFELSGANIPKTILVSDALFNFTPSKIVLDRFTGKMGKSNLTMTGDLTDYMAFFTRTDDLITGDMNLKCDTLDLNEWYTPKSTPTATKTIQKASLQSTIKTAWQVPANINFTFDSDIGVVKYQDMNITKLDGEIKIKDGTLTLHETGFNSLDARFNLSGDYDTRDISHPFFDFELDIKELDINRAYKEMKLVRDLVPAAANTYGQLSIAYKLKGELSKDMSPKTETLIGGGEIHIANAKINGMKIFEEISKAAKKEDINDPHLKDFVMKSEIKDNKIFVKPFSIKLSGLNTEIEGVSDISGTIQYIVRIELVPIDKLRIPFHVTGTYDNPKVVIGKGHALPQE